MSTLNFTPVTGEWFINAISMHCPAWNALDTRELWQLGAVRGSDKLIPGARGVRARYRRTTVTTVQIPFVIVGYADRNGVEAACTVAAQQIQLQHNLDFLNANIFSVTAGTAHVDTLLPSVLHMPDGAVRAANIHVLGFTPAGSADVAMAGTVNVSIPAGRFQ
jgi:hypothetical protein